MAVGTPAVRLTFAYDTKGIRLRSRTPVGKAAPEGEDTTVQLRADAVTAELHTLEGQVIYRQAVPSAMPATIEIFGGSEGASTVPNRLTSGAFSVIVPLDELAREVVLLAQPDALPSALRAVMRDDLPGHVPVELGRFPLREEPLG
ncbi:hypothetical protein [Streptosporangium carneum]|uniref:Uncharacterized protein n=1 Tax=Streptosporangium carneum TaxID=47481 RepID=A0A9W6HXU2_9ACTN|nr:hypothetical protein [Streptosporangium carneum]GLK07385.1 hypothetical protein GCM10017600_07900 [Streptosporangium carneum]